MLSSRRIYHTSMSLEEAWAIWSGVISTLKPLEGEDVPVTDSLGRITAAAVHARISSPFYHAAAMDGYAVRFQETFTASEVEPLRLRIHEQAYPVNTGDPLPEGFNAVVMVEEVNLSEDSIEIVAATSPYENVRVVGEDIVQTELILPENHMIRPVDMGAMISGGNHDISVRRRPFVTIIPTGNEVVSPGSPIRPGNIIDSNSFMAGAMINQWGGEYSRADVVPDNKELLKQRIALSADISDVVVVLAGASAGTRDFTPNAVDELGTVHVHGVRIKPGRPVLLGTVRGKPVMGLPGYPVAAAIAFELFGRPLLSRLLGRVPDREDRLMARLSRPVASSLGQEEFLRVKVGRVGDRLVATPVGRGAGALMTLQRADGIVRIPAMSEGIGADTEVDVRLLRSRDEIDNTVVCIGSHDNTLDVLANVLRRRYPAYSMSSAHVGSMGGLMAVKKSEAHVAGTHLLDEKSGEYNIPFIQRFLKGVPLKLINLVYRQQGLIVRKGNPLNIRDIHDLSREDVVFINRQAGSGTRLLTDKCLREKGIDQRSVRGYDKEEFTHMGVASAVASSAADAGMGILTAAIALDLEFIPVARERYDLVVRKEHESMSMVKALLTVVADDREFRESVLSLGGYDVTDMGKVMYEQ